MHGASKLRGGDVPAFSCSVRHGVVVLLIFGAAWCFVMCWWYGVLVGEGQGTAFLISHYFGAKS